MLNFIKNTILVTAVSFVWLILPGIIIDTIL